MVNFIKRVVNDFVESFNTTKKGFSIRKIIAAIIVGCIIYIHYKFVNSANAVTVLLYDMGFVLVMLGIVTIDQLYRFKNGGPVVDVKPDQSVTGTTNTNIIQNQI